MSGSINIRPPRLERFGPKTLVGLSRPHKNAQDAQAIYRQVAAQWSEYSTRLNAASVALPKTVYSIVPRMADGDLSFDYICCAEVPAQPGLITLQIPALYCATFQHTGHVSEIREFLHLLFGKVLPLAQLEPAPDAAGVPEFIERYDQSFDRETGTGSVDILIPLKE